MVTKSRMGSKITIAKTSDWVYHLVKLIPKGKVATYGQIALLIQNYNSKFKINPRWIGWVLHRNHDLAVPCHRVVDRTGRIAKSFAFGGWREQKRRLEIEGVRFKDRMHVDLGRYLWGGRNTVNGNETRIEKRKAVT